MGASHPRALKRRLDSVAQVLRALSDPPRWLRAAALVLVIGGLIQQVWTADSTGDWLWAVGMAVAAAIIGVGLLDQRRRSTP